MTLDDYWPPAEPSVVETPPRKHRHVWGIWSDGPAHEAMPEDLYPQVVPWCHRCGKIRDTDRSHRGRTSRNRGNRFELEVAAKLGGRRVGMYGDKVDVEVPDWLRVQCKNGASYPSLIDRWLRAIPVQAGILRAVVVGDAPGPGNRRRALITFDLDEFRAWYGRG